ncbi:hypothetical protein F4801DRAFT_580790 [Xylaria longipes]|nr:hypothetical protein F4801DRAFT_580790 [Xylaria longipes]
MVTGSHLWIVVPFAGTGGEERTTNPGWKYVHLASMSATTTPRELPTRQLLCVAPLWVGVGDYPAAVGHGDFMSKKTQGHHFHILDTPSADRYWLTPLKRVVLTWFHQQHLIPGRCNIILAATAQQRSSDSEFVRGRVHLFAACLRCCVRT